MLRVSQIHVFSILLSIAVWHMPTSAFADQMAGTHIVSKITNRVLGKVKQDTEEVYISEDGTRIARYLNGGQKIEISHLNQHSGIQYTYDSTDGNGWQKLDIPGLNLGTQSLKMLNQKMQHKHGHANYMGEGKVAGLPCKKYSVKENFSWCAWERGNLKHDKRMPATIILSSRWDFPKGDFSEEIVQSVKFDVAIDQQKFTPPAHVMKKSSSAPLKDRNNATSMWCRAEAKKTGVDPCADDQEDDEGWDVE